MQVIIGHGNGTTMQNMEIDELFSALRTVARKILVKLASPFIGTVRRLYPPGTVYLSWQEVHHGDFDDRHRPEP